MAVTGLALALWTPAQLCYGADSPVDSRIATVPAAGDDLQATAKKALESGHNAEAEAKFSLAAQQAEKSGNHKAHLECLNGLARALENQSKFALAEVIRKQALAAAQTSKGPTSPEYAECLDLLASNYYDTERFGESIPLYQKALTIREKGTDAVALSTAVNNLALAYSRANRDEEAGPLFKRALALDEKALGANSEDVAIDLNNLAAVEARAGRTGEARTMTDRAMTIQRHLGLDGTAAAAPTYMNLGRVQIAEGNLGLAEEPFRKALELREHANGPNHPSVARVLEEYAALLEKLERKPEASKMKERIYAIKSAGNAATTIAGSAKPVATAVSAQEAALDRTIKQAQDALSQMQKDESYALWKQAATEAQKLPETNPKVTYCLYKLGNCYQWKQQKPDAIATFKRAIELREKGFGTSDPGLACLYEELGQAYMSDQKYAEAQALYQKAVEIKTNAQLPERMLIQPLQMLCSTYAITSAPGTEQTARRLIAILENQPNGRRSSAYMSATATLGSQMMKKGRMAEGMRVMSQLSSMKAEDIAANAKKDYEQYSKEQDELLLKPGK